MQLILLFMNPRLCQIIHIFRFFQDYFMSHSGLSISMIEVFFFILYGDTLQDKPKVHCREFIPKALFISLPEVQFLYSVEHPVS